MSNQIANIKKLQKKSLAHEVTPTAYPLLFQVKSGTSGQTYNVLFTQGHDYRQATCNCRWGQGGGVCSHQLAAVRHLAAMKGNRVSFWLDEAAVARQKKRPVWFAGIWVTVRNDAPAAA